MDNSKIKECPECKQKLRIPLNIGGMVMICPNCRCRFHTDFKLKTNTVFSNKENTMIEHTGNKHREIKTSGKKFNIIV